MLWLFAPPSVDDLIRLLKAWRFWLLGAFIGALLGWIVYVIAPPPYRAQATVVVDFNMEQAWPDETDRQQFYYLERETRKLEEIAWSDAVLLNLEATYGIQVSRLRTEILMLSQPAEGGWHFYAEDPEPGRAAELAGSWAQSFVDAVQLARQRGEPISLNQYVQAAVTQADGLSVKRRVPLSTYLLVGSVSFLTIAAFFSLFFVFGNQRMRTRAGK